MFHGKIVYHGMNTKNNSTGQTLMYFKRKKMLNGKNTIKSFQRETVFEGKKWKVFDGNKLFTGKNAEKYSTGKSLEWE